MRGSVATGMELSRCGSRGVSALGISDSRQHDRCQCEREQSDRGGNRQNSAESQGRLASMHTVYPQSLPFCRWQNIPAENRPQVAF
jgi:hypothetical protein